MCKLWGVVKSQTVAYAGRGLKVRQTMGKWNVREGHGIGQDDDPTVADLSRY